MPKSTYAIAPKLTARQQAKAEAEAAAAAAESAREAYMRPRRAALVARFGTGLALARDGSGRQTLGHRDHDQDPIVIYGKSLGLSRGSLQDLHYFDCVIDKFIEKEDDFSASEVRLKFLASLAPAKFDTYFEKLTTECRAAVAKGELTDFMKSYHRACYCWGESASRTDAETRCLPAHLRACAPALLAQSRARSRPSPSRSFATCTPTSSPCWATRSRSCRR
jgi:hypothetical protein